MHLIALNQKGEVFAMGDDTFGQCGQPEGNWPTIEPFEESHYPWPVKINFKRPIKWICAGFWHNLAIDDNGALWGWGYNNW